MATPDDAERQIDQQPIAAPAALRPAPPSLVATRTALHRVAEQVVSPARRLATGRIGLRATPGGFGTPLFGDGRQVRVEGTELLVALQGDETRRAPLTTLDAAADHVGRDALPDDVSLDEAPLDVDAAAAAVLADVYALGASVLLFLRDEAGAGAEPSLIQLWPEHFDIAVELGAEATGARANYGVSPGDATHPEPYAYVGPWQAPEPGELWNATGFPGAELSYEEICAASDPADAVLVFMRRRLAALSRLS